MSLLPPLRECALLILGSAILSFGLYHIHSFSGITEGGVLGAVLLIQYWFGISPAVSGLIMNVLCYALGWRTLGHPFIVRSFIGGGAFSLFYALFEQGAPLWPGLVHMPLAAALAGAVFVGVGVGLCVRAGGAPTGDDALAMSLSHVFRWRIQWTYLATDLLVLALSTSYIPLEKLAYSLLTVLLSGQIIGLVQRFRLPVRSC